jgi:uncharacterized membrane protein
MRAPLTGIAMGNVVVVGVGDVVRSSFVCRGWWCVNGFPVPELSCFRLGLVPLTNSDVASGTE